MFLRINDDENANVAFDRFFDVFCEVQAAIELLRDVRWMRQFLGEMGYVQTGSTRVYEDNNGCIGQATGSKGMKKARHYLVALGALNEAVHATEIHLYRIDSNDNPADSFTKALGGPTHVHLATKTLGYNMDFLRRNWHTTRTNNEGIDDSTHPGSEGLPGEFEGEY